MTQREQETFGPMRDPELMNNCQQCACRVSKLKGELDEEGVDSDWTRGVVVEKNQLNHAQRGMVN